MNQDNSNKIRLTRFLYLMAGLLLFVGCANFRSVQSAELYRTEPYLVRNCYVYGVRANFPQFPRANDLPIKLGIEIEKALQARGLNVSFKETTWPEVATSIHGIIKVPGTYFVVSSDSVVMEQNQYGATYPNGISFYKVSAFDGATGSRVAEYKLKVATGALNFKSAEGGFKDTAQAFVVDCIDGSGRLMAPPR